MTGFNARIEIELEKRKQSLSKRIQGMQERREHQQEELKQNTLEGWL